MKPPVNAVERRSNPELRSVFDEVYARVEPFFDTSRTWGGAALTMLVYRVVRESHPHLDAVQAQTLVSAMKRVHRARHAGGARAQHTRPQREPA